MKKTLKTGKKILALFMATLMAMTAWVFFEPTKAEAVNSGSYYYKITITTSNNAEGWNSDSLVLTHKSNNGQGSDSNVTILTNDYSPFNSNTTTTYTGTTTGFPYKYTFKANWGGGMTWRALQTTITLEVGKNANSLTQILTHTFDKSSSAFNAANIDETYSADSSTFPKANSVVFDLDPSTVTVPKTGNATTTMRTHLLDQYGVVVSSSATGYTKSASLNYTTGTSVTAGTTATSYDPWTITVTNTAKMSDAASKTVRATVSYTFNGVTKTAYKDFTINDVKYKFTLNGNGGTVTSPSSGFVETDYNSEFNVVPNASRTGFEFKGFYTTKYDDSYETPKYSGTALSSSTKVIADRTYYAAWQAKEYTSTFVYKNANNETVNDEIKTYYGRNVALPEIPATITAGDYTYTFTGWDKALPTTQDDTNQTYTAKYDEAIAYADLGALEAAIAAAEAKQAEEYYQQNGYTAETVSSFETALKNAKDILDPKPLASAQATVDALTQTLTQATANLTLKKFMVVFADENGQIVKDGFHYVEYGQTVTVPKDLKKDSDSTYHYVFNVWEGGYAAGDVITPTDDMIIKADFNEVEHTFTKSTTDSSCTEAGVETYTCDCGYSYSVAIDPKDHNWSTEKEVIVEATCTTEGTKATVCQDCGAILDGSEENFDALGHDWNNSTWTVFEADAEGVCVPYTVETRTCPRCEFMEVRKTAKDEQHNFGELETVSATCTVDGYTKRTCADCGLVEIKAVADDKAAGHSWKTEKKEATCVSSGYERVYCETCNLEQSFTFIPASETHTFAQENDGWTVEVKETCGSKGIAVKKCTVCENIIETKLIDATNAHTWIDEKTLVAPDCQQTGTYQHTCETCKLVETYMGVELGGHKYDDGDVTEPTCTEDGYTTYTCKLCGDKKVADEVPALNHVVVTETIDPTCTASGRTIIKCSRCDEVFSDVEDETRPATGHDFQDDGKGEIVKPATCDEEGIRVIYCLNGCGEAKELSIPKTGHNWVLDSDPDKTFAATCTAPGNNHYYCANSDCEETKDEAIEQLEHQWVVDKDSDKTYDPTCETEGNTHYYCANNCGETKDEAVPALGHSYLTTGSVEHEPTCSEAGYIEYVCSRDPSHPTYKEYTNKPLKNHEWQTSIDNKTGVVTISCKNCDEVITATVPTGHTLVAVDDAANKIPTCTEVGYQVYKCSAHEDCGVEIKVELPMKAHSLSTVTEGFCGKGGTLTTRCTECNKIIEQRKLTDKDHIWIKTKVYPTCTQNGYDEYSCKRCGAVIKTNFDLAKGHNYPAEGVYEEATCVLPARWVFKCQNCTDEAHVDNDHCGCDHMLDYIRYIYDQNSKPTGHDWDDWKYEASGDHYYKYRVCKTCLYKEYEFDENGYKAVYYQIQFVNQWTTKEYEILNGGKTKLAESYQDKVLDTIYVRKGSDAVYTAAKPKREKDRDYGAYIFEGWASDRNGNNVISKDSKNNINLIENINANTTAYAKFTPDEDIRYTVIFWNIGKYGAPDVKLTREHDVPHGEAARYIAGAKPWDLEDDQKPTLPSNVHMKYEFKGWDYDTRHIYDNVDILAMYDSIPMTYKIIYHDYNGDVIGEEVFQYGDQPKVTFTDDQLAREEDGRYLYSFDCWRMNSSKGMEYSLNGGLTVPNDTWAEYDPENENNDKLTDKQKGIVNVYASYHMRPITHKLTVIASDLGGLYVPVGSLVEVYDVNGQLVETGRIDSESKCVLNIIGGEYRVVVHSGDDAGFSDFIKVPDVDTVTVFVQASQDINDGKDHCSCICHSFLSRMWITFLNIIYRLFGKKTVCCYDMYATHGDRLVYFQNIDN